MVGSMIGSTTTYRPSLILPSFIVRCGELELCYPSRLTFAQIAPYLTLFLNGVGWSPSFPRLMTKEQLTAALQLARGLDGFRFTNIGDISCDVGVRGETYLHSNIEN
jgi:hypothetical protein